VRLQIGESYGGDRARRILQEKVGMRLAAGGCS
jgi:hypothetical protein